MYICLSTSRLIWSKIVSLDDWCRSNRDTKVQVYFFLLCTLEFSVDEKIPLLIRSDFNFGFENSIMANRYKLHSCEPHDRTLLPSPVRIWLSYCTLYRRYCRMHMHYLLYSIYGPWLSRPFQDEIISALQINKPTVNIGVLFPKLFLPFFLYY